MKQLEAKSKIVQILIKGEAVTVKELNESTQIPNLQLYQVLSALGKAGAVKVDELDGKKSYTLIDSDKLNDEPLEALKVKSEKIKVIKLSEDEAPKEKPKKNKTGRDLTTYKFNGNEYNKTRLSHALVLQVVKDKKPSLKALLELFPDEIIRPYGMIRPIKEAKEISKERLRFLIKPDEEIIIRDCSIAVSNQWTPDRMEILLGIAKKLGYKIK